MIIITKNINIIKNIILIISLLIYSYLVFIGNNRYSYNITYTKSIILTLLISLFVYIYGVIINKEKTYQNNINIYIILYFILLISVTFFIGRLDISFYEHWNISQAEPFHTITSQLNYGSNFSILKNVIGNSVMLIPLSFLLMIKNKKYKNILWQSIIVLPVIFGIEIFQAATNTGVFDIDDILLNYLSTVIFTFLITRFSLIDKIKKILFTNFNINKNISYVTFTIVTITLITYNSLLIFKII